MISELRLLIYLNLDGPLLAKLMGHHEENSCFSEFFFVEIDSSINFDLPPIYDDYEVPLVYRGEEYSEFGIDSSIDLNQPPIFDKYEDEVDWATTKTGSVCSACLIDVEGCNAVTGLLHGGWWGGWHKGLSEFRGI